ANELPAWLELSMSFVEISTLNGGQVHVAVDAVYRITRGSQAAGQAALTRIEFGSDSQLTQMTAAQVVDLLRNASAKLVELTAPDDTNIYLAVAAISAIRDADPHMDAPEAKAIVSIAGHRQAVRQSRQEVLQAVAAA